MDGKNDYDKLIMLLSADWFLPYWETAGLPYDEKRKLSIQSEARAVVVEFMKGADVYWNISFSEGRREQSWSSFLGLLQRSGLRNHELGYVANLLSELSGSEDERTQTTVWLFGAIIEYFSQGDPSIAAPPLKDATATLVKSAFRNSDLGFSKDGLEKAALSSEPNWDRYLRSLTPDLPTYLSDFANGLLRGATTFKRFWQELIKVTDEGQRKLLVDWLLSESRKLADPNFVAKLPRWMSTS